MKGLPRASSAAAGGPKAGARLFSFGAEPGAVPRGARGVDTNVEVRSNGQSAARPRSNQTFEPETKRSGQGPPLCAAPEKSRGIVTRANRRGQPRRPFLWIFAAARRAPSRAAALALAGLVGALATPPARAAPLRSAGEHDRVDDVAARYVGDPAAAVRELRELVAAGRASATEAVAAALLAPAEGPPELAAVVARPGLALELIRRLPRPTPAAWLPALAAETGGELSRRREFWSLERGYSVRSCSVKAPMPDGRKGFNPVRSLTDRTEDTPDGWGRATRGHP